jgi:hypothetical protein
MQGRVTLDGLPLAEGSITFLEAQGRAALGGGEIKDGDFRVSLPPGAYRVQVFATRPVPGKTIPEMGNAPVLESLIPPRYNTETTLNAEVTEAAEPLSFALRSR